MNFFQRRRILGRANYLDLRPVRVLGHEVRPGGDLNLLMPRFRNRMAAALFQPPAKERFIRIRLDRFGSLTWLMIDGESTVEMISAMLNEQYPDDFKPAEETAGRVVKFLSRLYQQRYITFLEIEPEKVVASQ